MGALGRAAGMQWGMPRHISAVWPFWVDGQGRGAWRLLRIQRAKEGSDQEIQPVELYRHRTIVLGSADKLMLRHRPCCRTHAYSKGAKPPCPS